MGVDKKTIKKVILLLEKEIGPAKAVVSHNSPFKVLMATILSQRTKDENTARASSRLFELADTPKKILKLAHVRLEQAIKPAGFYRNKTKTIIKVCGLLLGKYNGNVPDSMNELIKLPGVGEKTAACVIVYGFGKPEIPVDVHVGRVSK